MFLEELKKKYKSLGAKKFAFRNSSRYILMKNLNGWMFFFVEKIKTFSL